MFSLCLEVAVCVCAGCIDNTAFTDAGGSRCDEWSGYPCHGHWQYPDYTEADMHAVNDKLVAELAADGVQFEKIYYAPESPEDESRGRKPSPKFLQDAAAEFGLGLSQSFMIGDKTADIQCGWNAGVKKSILVRTGYGAELEQAEPITVAPAAIADDIAAAADWILSDQ